MRHIDPYHGHDPDYADDPGFDPEPCPRCEGEGCYHDCGEDTCCCANPDEDDLIMCEECNGTGYLR